MTSRKQPMTTMAHIPDDVISNNIFIRLPAKQLAQMRSLSKQWNAFLSHPDFVKSHLDRSMNKNNDKILLVFEGGMFSKRQPFTAHPCRSPDLQLTDFVKRLVVNTPPLCQKGYCCVIGSVNGLICFSYHNDSEVVVHIWNPSLSALLPLPPFSMPSVKGYDVLFGFGFDPKTDDYKVVKLTSKVPVCGFGRSLVKRWALPVEVYSMRRGSWKFNTAKVPFKHPEIYSTPRVCVDGHNGHLHWQGSSGDRPKILAFDLSLETFNAISFPNSIQGYERDCYNVIGFITGKLCVMSCIEDSECEVWVMDEYGVAESWVKHLVFPADFGVLNQIGFTLNNEFVFMAKANDEFLLSMYDPIASKVKIMARYPFGNRFKIVPYVESLVWVAPAKRGTIITSVHDNSP